jgi:hypothetical protein
MPQFNVSRLVFKPEAALLSSPEARQAVRLLSVVLSKEKLLLRPGLSCLFLFRPGPRPRQDLLLATVATFWLPFLNTVDAFIIISLFPD